MYSAGAALLLCCFTALALTQTHNLRYFDPHTHVNGILPWHAFANLPRYTANRDAELDMEEVTKLWEHVASEVIKVYCDDDMEPSDCPPATGPFPLYTSGSRIGSASYATALMFPKIPEGASMEMISGLFDRLFTATPFTEFDSAYKIRDFARGFNNDTYYQDTTSLQDDLCVATIRELTEYQNVSRSEQSVSLTDYKWKESKLCWLRCFLEQPDSEPSRAHQIFTMALTDRLAWSSSSKFSSWETTGTCQEAGYYLDALPSLEALEQEAILFAKSVSAFDNAGAPGTCGEIVKRAMNENPRALYDVVVGIDIAAAETTCFTNEGMQHFFIPAARQLVEESKLRHTPGHKLLFHTHVGEGFSVYYGKDSLTIDPSKDFPEPFTVLPGDPAVRNIRSNVDQARNNVKKIVEAIESMIDDDDLKIKDHVIFRLGHVTHIDRETSRDIAAIGQQFDGFIEVDINLDSNLVTGAYPIPDGIDMTEINALLADNSTHFLLNDLPKTLIPDATDCEAVGRVYGGFDALKYLLMDGASIVIPTILGTDGTVVEHANMTRQHQMGQCLIAYWNCHDEEFRGANVSSRVFAEGTCRHIRNMGRYTNILQNFDINACIGTGGINPASYECPSESSASFSPVSNSQTISSTSQSDFTTITFATFSQSSMDSSSMASSLSWYAGLLSIFLLFN